MVRVIPFAFGVLFFLSLGGCTGFRQTDMTGTVLTVSDSVTTVHLNPDNTINNTRVTIANTSDSVQSFYLTPVEYDFRKQQTLVRSVIKDASSRQDAAIALWKFVKENTCHGLPVSGGHIPHDPLRLITSIGSGLCDDRNTALAVLLNETFFNDTIFKARVMELGGHMVAEVEYDNAWHMFDTDLGVYYLDENGKIASVEYISQHPEIVKVDFGQGMLPGMLTVFTIPYIRNIYASQSNNRENAWHGDFLYMHAEINSGIYDRTTSLNSGDEMILEASRLTTTERILRALFLHTLSDYTGKGILKRNITFPKTGEYIVGENSPYVITQVNLHAENPGSNIKVYYSPDSVRWFYKGTLTGSNKITFTPFSWEDEPCSFNFFVKYVPENVERKAVVKTQYDFLFSPLLFTNPEKTFKIVRTGNDVQSGLNLKIEYTK